VKSAGLQRVQLPPGNWFAPPGSNRGGSGGNEAVGAASRGRNGQFLLTGSQKFTLISSVSESLAGRAGIVELETLSLAEIQRAVPETTPENAVVRGGFPELHANPSIDHVAFYNSYLATYLERDVRSLANVGSLRDFERFLRACALRSTNLLNKADLARDVGISPTTASQTKPHIRTRTARILREPYAAVRQGRNSHANHTPSCARDSAAELP
jgi:uncharacterized protein